MEKGIKFKTTDEYFSAFPAETRSILEKIRSTVKEAAPQSQEVISYNMPAIKQKRVLVYYAAYANHIGFYPTSLPIQVFVNELTPYKTSRGAIQFPIDKPIPLELITKMVKFRLQQEEEKRFT